MKRLQPIRVVWPLPKTLWQLIRLWPFKRYQYVYWAVMVESDGVYRIEKEES